MNRIVFARGRAPAAALAAPAPAQSSRFFVEQASSHFAPGGLAFIARADGSRPQFLGHVVSADSDSLATTLALREAREAGARVWSAEAGFVWPAPPCAPLKREHSTGVSIRRALSGALYAVRVAAPGRTDRLRFERLPAGAWRAFLVWVEERLGGGTLDFAYVDERLEVSRARLLGAQLAAAHRDLDQVDAELELAVLAEGETA